jgi:hypothetical protein
MSSFLARTGKGIFAGALLGGSLASIDGALLGALFSDSVFEGALRWAGYFAAAGAILGGLVGGIAAVVSRNLVLNPPDEDERP